MALMDIAFGISQANKASNAAKEAKLVNDASNDAVERWAQQNGYKMSDETLDYLYKQFFTEKNNETAWQRTLESDNTKYQRMVEDMRKAGLNPFVTSFGSPSSLSASAGNLSGESFASIRNQNKQSGANILGNVIGAIASIAGAAIMAMVLA